MQYRKEISGSVFENWPEAFYALPEDERRPALKKHMELFPDDEGDRRRLEILQNRYDGKKDLYLFSWMMLKVTAQEPVGFLNRRSHEKEIRAHLSKLGIFTPDEYQIREWEAFARVMIHAYADSPSFRAALFGMGSVGDRNTALRLANEIILITEKAPSSIGRREEALPFARVIREQYIRIIPDGEELFRSVQPG